MGKVIPFHEARASFMPKTAGSTCFSNSPRAREKVRNFSGGMEPRAFQFETADMPTPPSDAAAAVPPNASTTASTVLSMSAKYSRNVNLSTVHETAVEIGQSVGSNSPMAETAKTIGPRLEITREALELTAAELCRQIKCAPNRWSQYENGDRKITLAIANKLCDEFGLTLDWIYRANPAGLPHALRIKMPRAAA